MHTVYLPMRIDMTGPAGSHTEIHTLGILYGVFGRLFRAALFPASTVSMCQVKRIDFENLYLHKSCVSEVERETLYIYVLQVFYIHLRNMFKDSFIARILRSLKRTPKFSTGP